MADYSIDMREIQFVLFELLKIQDTILTLPKYQHLTKDDIGMLLEEAKKLAVDKVAPLNAIADREGCHFSNGNVTTPAGFKEVYDLYCQQGWVGAYNSTEYGGQNLPLSVAPAAGDIFAGACPSFSAYPALTSASTRPLVKYGTEELKKTYMAKMCEGKWTGTMLLTEPQAGSAVGDIATTAKKDGDAWALTGTKSFITAGDHDLAENIIHFVLARTEGAPKGIKGLSLFLVPKILVTPDGKLGKRNDIVCTRIEEKMGLHGSATALLALGENGKCTGYMIGKEGQGIQIMFHLMNEARLAVGILSLSQASASYQFALQYAKERIQGTDFAKFKDVDAERVAIIKHPDVRQMLLTMKAYTEAMRALLYATAYYDDLAENSTDEAAREKYHGLVEILTPICKAWCSDNAFYVSTLGVQVFGGYGYCQEYPVEQIVRDLKINSIYEGTNGIQALDLLGRKVSSKGGALFMAFIQEINSWLDANKSVSGIESLAEDFAKAKDTLAEVTMHLGGLSMSGDMAYPVLNATSYLELFGDVVAAYFLLQEARVAADKVNSGDPFYASKIKTAEFFIRNLLPRAYWRSQAILKGSRAPLDINFGE